MSQNPLFDVHGNSENDLQRLQWLRDIFDATGKHVSTADEPAHEVCHWPGSIVKIDYTPELMTVSWSDSISLGCFGWAFMAAWRDIGDDTPVEHLALDEIDDAGRESADFGD